MGLLQRAPHRGPPKILTEFKLGYFLLGDSLNTTVTVIGTLQNSIVAYNTLQLTYLLIVGIAAQALGIFAFWQTQKRYGLSTKTMFNAVAVGIILLDGWGMIGIWTQRFGFHHVWEVWLYQAFYGLFVCKSRFLSQIPTSWKSPANIRSQKARGTPTAKS